MNFFTSEVQEASQAVILIVGGIGFLAVLFLMFCKSDTSKK